MNRKQILEKAISTYGREAQTNMMLEEMGELITAINKYRRAYIGAEKSVALANIVEEMADVQIMLDQMRLMFGDTTEQEEYKVQRLASRLGVQL